MMSLGMTFSYVYIIYLGLSHPTYTPSSPLSSPTPTDPLPLFSSLPFNFPTNPSPSFVLLLFFVNQGFLEKYG